MHTSYYAKIKVLQEMGYNNLVAISSSIPKWLGEVNLKKCYELAPPYNLVSGVKQGLISWDQYEEEYNKYLDNIDMGTIISGLGKDAVLLCYERSTDNCHRHTLAKRLRATYKDMEIEEVPFNSR